MNLPEELLPSGGTLVITIVSIIGLWFKFLNKVENLERDMAKSQLEYKDKFDKEMSRIKETNDLQWSKIDEAFRWHAAHEKEAWENRNALELKIAMHTGEIDNIRSICKSIESKLDALIEKSDR